MGKVISTKFKIFVIFAISLMSFCPEQALSQSKNAAASPKKDNNCVTCTPEIATGSPLDANTTKMLKLLSTSQHAAREMDFFNIINSYCLSFEHLDGGYELKRKLIDHMQKSPFTVDEYFLRHGCPPQFLGGSTMPIIHKAAENTTERLELVQALHKYYTVDRSDKPSLWPQIVNAKNDRGWTMLDYLHYMVENNKLIKEEEEGVNEFFKYVCNNGGRFAHFTDQKCPMKPVTIK